MQLREIFFSFFFPQKCVMCGASKKYFSIDQQLQNIDDFFSKFFLEEIFASFFCKDCFAEMPIWVNEPYCTRCGEIFTGKSGESHLCYKCIEAKPAYEKARSVFELNDLLLHIIHRYKYNGDMYLAKPLAALLLAGYWMHWQGSEPDIFIPIPLHRKKAFKRGYNQSYILLKEMMKIGKKLELPIKGTQLNAFSVERKRNTISQTGLSREKRKENMKNAFHVIKKEEIDQKKVLLIDDVMTTGATVDICANSLLAAGAASVEVLTLARARL